MVPIDETGYKGLDSPKSFDFQQFLSDTDKEFDEKFLTKKRFGKTMIEIWRAEFHIFLHSRLRALLEEVEGMKGTKYKNTVYEMVWNEGISAAVEVVKKMGIT